MTRGSLGIALALLLPGCAYFRGDPVPPAPPPPPQVLLAQGQIPQDPERWLEREDGEVAVFKPLAAARKAAAKAAAWEAVGRYAPEQFARAQAALADAERAWAEIEADPVAQPQKLAIAVHLAHGAKRWAQIALAVAERETGLRQLADDHNRLVAVEAQVVAQVETPVANQDSRFLGKQLVPGELGVLRFQLGTAKLTTASEGTLANLVAFLAAHPRYRLAIAGHTDNSAPSAANLSAFLVQHLKIAKAIEGKAEGVAAYNQVMSERRAAAVRAALVAAGVDPARLEAAGYGASRPIADNDTESGRRRNRRVEIRVITLAAEPPQ